VVLILGTATNIPTLKGMQALLKRAPDLVAAAKGLQIVVLGYGTEILAPLVEARGLPITIMGGVSEEVLNKYLLRTKVNLAYQEGTTGMLTRIQELLYCGIPIIANNIAARSYHNLPGVHVTESIDEMLNVLASFQSFDFPPPETPEKLEQQLVERIRKLQGFS
jgi:glycosyltransferase involved in cell wall biosynthesis